MKTAEFLNLIEHWGVMPPMQVANLRKQVLDSEHPVHPVLLARRLVEEGYINSYFAKTLLAGGPESTGIPPGGTASDVATTEAGDEMDRGKRTDAWRDDLLDEEDAGFHFDGLELPPIEGADWLTRSVDTEPIDALPSLASTALAGGGADGDDLPWWQQTGFADLPWWVIGLAGVGAIAIIGLLLALLL